MRPTGPSIPHAVAARALDTPDAVAISAHDDVLTYADLEQRARCLADRLGDLGIGPGIVVAVCLPFAEPGSVPDGDWAVLAALGVGQMGLGLALLTVGARLIPPAQVAVISLLEIVLGPLWVWLAYEERPSAATVAGGVVVVAAVVVQAWSPGRTARGREASREAVSEAHV